VQGLDGIGASITSTISSPAALLSGTSRRDKAKDATGGLLRKLGNRGVLAIKDYMHAYECQNRTARCFANCSPMPLADPVTTARPPRNWYGGSLLITRRAARNESTHRSRWLLVGVL
jgi:hypothetical protein